MNNVEFQVVKLRYRLVIHIHVKLIMELLRCRLWCAYAKIEMYFNFVLSRRTQRTGIYRERKKWQDNKIRKREYFLGSWRCRAIRAISHLVPPLNTTHASQEFISAISSTIRPICFCLTAVRTVIDFCMRQHFYPIVLCYSDICYRSCNCNSTILKISFGCSNLLA